MKLIIYSTSTVTFCTLGFFNNFTDVIRHNFHLKFATISILLSFVVAFDGFERNFYHYIAYGLINLCTTILVYKEIQSQTEAEYRLYLGENYDKVEKGEGGEINEPKVIKV